MRWLAFFLLAFLSACTTAVQPGSNEIDNSANTSIEPNISPENASSNYSSGRTLTPERQRLREARLTVDFSLLTAENCDAMEELHAKNITKVKNNWKELQEDLDKQEEKANGINEQLRNEMQGSAKWEALKNDYDELQEEIDDLEDELEELERLHGNMVFTLDEMEKECLVLKKHNP